MNEPTFAAVILVAMGALLVAIAPQISRSLVRLKARRLPLELSLRMEEEWLAELRALSNRVGQLSFAVALMLTRRRAFVVPDQDVSMLHDRRVSLFAGRKTLVILSTTVFALAAFALSFLLPVRYASTALLLVRKRDVAEEFVRDVTNISSADRMKFMKAYIRSRMVMVQLINEFDLGQDKQKPKTMDQRVHQMQDSIEITTSSPETFGDFVTLRYVGSNPEIAQKITRKLTDIVVKQDIQARQFNVNGAVEFFSSELERLVARMKDQNEKLSQERRTHGEESATSLVLEHEMLQTTYRTLFTKLEAARLSESLDVKQQGAQIQLLDPANLGVPVGPDRLSITGIGALTGFGLGAMAVFGMNRKQSRVLA